MDRYKITWNIKYDYLNKSNHLAVISIEDFLGSNVYVMEHQNISGEYLGDIIKTIRMMNIYIIRMGEECNNDYTNYRSAVEEYLK